MKVITIDLGATSGRIMVVDHHDHSFSYKEVSRFSNYLVKNRNSLRWDVDLILKNISKGLRKAFKEDKDISSVGIDTWGVDYALLDNKDKIITKPYCYRDPRSLKGVKNVLSLISYENIYKITGIQYLHFNTIFQLASEPKSRIEKTSSILLIPDLIAFYLTGEKRCELTDLSTTSLYDQHKKDLSSELLKIIGVRKDQFGKLIYPKENYGNLKKEYMPDGYKIIPVIATPSHDTASAVLGVNGTNRFLYISSGTWSLEGVELTKPLISPDSYKLNFTNEIGYEHSIRFLKNTMGMFLLDNIRKEWKKQNREVSLADLKSVASASIDIDSYIDVDSPEFETPDNPIQKVETYLRKTSQEIPFFQGQWIKMIYQSMALKYRQISENIQKLSLKDIDEIIIVGGGNQASLLNQYTANALNRIVKTGAKEATVLGNASSQLISLKDISSIKEARNDISNSVHSEIYYPSNSEEWNQKYQTYLKITKRKEE